MCLSLCSLRKQSTGIKHLYIGSLQVILPYFVTLSFLLSNIQSSNCYLSVFPHLTLWLPDQICNSPYCQLYNSYNVSSENLILDQLIIPKLIFFFILITCLLVIVLILKREILSWSLMGVKGLTCKSFISKQKFTIKQKSFSHINL